jgi:hypothetical protein
MSRTFRAQNDAAGSEVLHQARCLPCWIMQTRPLVLRMLYRAV